MFFYVCNKGDFNQRDKWTTIKKMVRGNSRLDDWGTLGRILEQPLVLRLGPCALHLAPGSSWWSLWSSPFLYLDHQIHHKVCESSSLPVPSSNFLFSIHLKFLLLLLDIWTSTYMITTATLILKIRLPNKSNSSFPFHCRLDTNLGGGRIQ